jgi:hypothetical protein
MLDRKSRIDREDAGQKLRGRRSEGKAREGIEVLKY